MEKQYVAQQMHIITALLEDETISLGQITVDSKRNEIPVVRELIELIEVKEQY